jgi:hypothetical protein
MSQMESKKEKHKENKKHSSPEIVSNNEVEKHKSKGTVKGI